MKTLTEVADLMALGKVMAEPERYLARQIKSGRIRGRKVGRSWMMTDEDIAAALDAFAAPPPRRQPDPTAGTVSVGSMRRRRIA